MTFSISKNYLGNQVIILKSRNIHGKAESKYRVGYQSRTKIRTLHV